MPSGTRLTVWLLVAVVLWSDCVIGKANSSANHIPQHYLPPNHTSKDTYHLPYRNHLESSQQSGRAVIPTVGRRNKRDYFKHKRHNLITLIGAASRPQYPTYQGKFINPHNSQNVAFESAFGPWLTKRSGPAPTPQDSKDTNQLYADKQNKIDNKGQDEINMSLKQVGSSINRAFFRNTRSSQRHWDIPQIGELTIYCHD